MHYLLLPCFVHSLLPVCNELAKEIENSQEMQHRLAFGLRQLGDVRTNLGECRLAIKPPDEVQPFLCDSAQP